ncbi:hypothetical protein MTO96_049455 [Rhipicephalus appendiculatus]
MPRVPSLAAADSGGPEMFLQDRTHIQRCHIMASSSPMTYHQGSNSWLEVPTCHSLAPISEALQVLVAEAVSQTSLTKPGRHRCTTFGELVAGFVSTVEPAVFCTVTTSSGSRASRNQFAWTCTDTGIWKEWPASREEPREAQPAAEGGTAGLRPALEADACGARTIHNTHLESAEHWHMVVLQKVAASRHHRRVTEARRDGRYPGNVFPCGRAPRRSLPLKGKTEAHRLAHRSSSGLLSPVTSNGLPDVPAIPEEWHS